MPQTVTQAYLMGIGEARSTLRRFARDGVPLTIETFEQARRNVPTGFSGDMAELYKGQRAFWSNQIRKARAA